MISFKIVPSGSHASTKTVQEAINEHGRQFFHRNIYWMFSSVPKLRLQVEVEMYGWYWSKNHEKVMIFFFKVEDFFHLPFTSLHSYNNAVQISQITIINVFLCSNWDIVPCKYLLLSGLHFYFYPTYNEKVMKKFDTLK